VNPPSSGDGIRARVDVLGPNLLSVKLSSGPLLVKLQSLGTPFDRSSHASATSMLEQLAREGESLFIPANADCSASIGRGSVGALGQVFSASGKSFSESLINRSLASVTSDPCGGNLLTTCYRALQEEAQRNFAGEVGRLLWKPISDSDGNLAIHTEPSGTTVIVNGETGRNQGGGNGYGSLARFPKPGCAYGPNVRVEVLNRNGAKYSVNGSTTITIPNGCNRYCVNGPSLEQCVKR
jgi:hypothetical protein